MIITTSFSKFIEKISLDDTRAGMIQRAHETVRDILATDEEIKLRYHESFLQGSYRLGTAISPLDDSDYDVDVMLSMNLIDSSSGSLYPSTTIIDWVAGRLKKNATYKDKVSTKKKCVHVQYAKGLHMDIVPAHRPKGDDDPLLVPADWKQSHPKGYRDWCIARNAECPNSFYSIVKMLKWWRNLKYTEKGSPKSILLTTLVGMHLPDDSKSLDEALLQTMRGINDYLVSHATVPAVVNPSLPDERLSDSWALADYLSFKAQWARATATAQEAIESQDEGATIDLWNSTYLFDGTFPKTRHGDAKAISEAMKSGILGVTPSGMITKGGAVSTMNVRPTRFYGEK